MAEYRIVAKIDPAGVTAGRAKVKQELAGLEADVTRAGNTGAAAMEKMSAAQFKAAGGVAGLTRANKDAAASQKSLEAATERVLAAVDQEAAAQLKLNRLLADAKRALDAGRISTEQYGRVQKLAADGSAQLNQNLGRTRAGFTQLSFQVGDVAQGLALGTRASTIFAQQSGQVIQSLQVMGGQGNAFLRFLGGPWGIALSTAAVVIGPFIGKLFEGNSALGEAIDKLQKDAAETDVDRKAKELYTRSEIGLTHAVRDRLAAMDEAIKKSRTQGEQDNLLAQTQQNAARATREQTKALLENAIAQYRVTQINSTAPGTRGEVAALGAPQAGSRVAFFQNLLAENDKALHEADVLFTRSLGELAQESAKAASDPVEGIRQKYEGPNGIIASLTATALADKEITTSRTKQLDLTKRLTAEYKKMAAEIKAAQAAQRETSDGVERFRSRQQAIGIAGRELLGAGLKVSENVQFGGVHANHPGMGNAAHGQFAIDVNQGSGIVEANAPDIKGRFDALARSYQKRGYRVLWNGQVYEAFGNGPARPIPGGQDQHHDHMHIEAPTVIVGKPTQSSYAEAELRDAKNAITQGEQEQDFVQRVVDQAGTRGQGDRASQLKARIAQVSDEFKTRFGKSMGTSDQARVTAALTDADAREIAEAFKTAYVDPLERLRAALGKTSVEQKIANEEIKRRQELGRDLRPDEEALIRNWAQQGDLLDRENRILTDIRQPLEDYRQELKALNELLATGQINQAGFNARVAELNAPVRALVSQAPSERGQPGGINVSDQNPGGKTSNYQTFGDASKAMDENARYAAELDTYQKYREQLQAMGINFDALEEAARQRHADNLNQIDAARRDLQLSYAENIAGSLYTILSGAFGKQSTLARAAFGVEKAFTIARASLAIYQDVAQAIKVGFPANIPLIAEAFAQGAVIISAIRSITVPNGYKAGGFTGNLGRDQEAGVVHGQEFVVNADATARNRALLEAINSGQLNARSQQASNDNGGGASRSVNVQIQNFAPGVEFETQRGPTIDDVVVIARRVARQEAPGAVAADMGNANGKTGKALRNHYGVSKKRA